DHIRKAGAEVKILSFDCHESLIHAWAVLGHEIHLLRCAHWKWNESKRAIPENVKLLPIGFQPDPKDYDFGVAFNFYSQGPILDKIGLPYIISIASLAEVHDKNYLK